MRPGRLRILIVVGALSQLPGPAGAEPATGAKNQAAELFRAAEEAFRRHDYADAAAHFEQANAIAPHPAALFNAATAWDKAGDPVRAANLCARYLRDAPDDDSRRTRARALLADLTPRVGRVQPSSDGGVDLAIDGAPFAGDVLYVNPGDHVASASFEGRVVEKKFVAVAGAVTKVRLDGPATGPDELDEEDHDAEAVDEPSSRPTAGADASTGWSPAWFWTGVALTTVLGGATVWSGLDTNAARESFDAEPTRKGYDDGLGRQTRTNLLLAMTAGAAVLTTAVGVFATDFGGPGSKREVSVSVGPLAASAKGRF